MPVLFSRRDIAIGLALAILMAVTRSHQLAMPLHLPNGSDAVFFLAAIFLRPAFFLPIFMIEALVIDYVAITFGGISNFCVTPGYLCLIPAFTASWLAGRWLARRHDRLRAHPLAFATSLLCGSVAAELFASGGYYLFSGRFPTPTLPEFMARFETYYPANLAGMVLWVAIAILVQRAIVVIRRPATQNNNGC